MLTFRVLYLFSIRLLIFFVGLKLISLIILFIFLQFFKVIQKIHYKNVLARLKVHLKYVLIFIMKLKFNNIFSIRICIFILHMSS
jgi:hypothetical protein